MLRFNRETRETLLRWLLEADRRGDREWIESVLTSAVKEPANEDAAALADVATVLLSESVAPTVVPLGVDNAPSFDGSLNLREAADGDGWTWWATLIEAGMSANGRFYSAAVLRQALPLFQAGPVRVFDSHGDGRADRPNRDMCGWIDKVRLSEDGNRIEGRLNVLRRAGWLREMLRQKPDLVGLSISALGTTATQMIEGVQRLAVQSLTRVLSTDIVTHAACGGRIVRPLAESAGVLADVAPPAPSPTPHEESEQMTPEEIKAAIAAMQAQIATLTEALSARPAPAPAAAPVADATATQIAALTEAISGMQAQLAEARESESRATSRALVESRLAGQLPAVAEHVRATVGDRIVEATELDALIERTRNLVARTAPARPGVRIEVGQAPEDKMKEMIRQMIAGVPGGFRSLKEAYCTWTGESPIGPDSRGLGLRIIRDLRRAGAGWDTTLVYGGARLDEAVTTASFGNAFLDSLYKVFISDLERPGALLHRQLAREVSLSDFATQSRVRLGGYAGNLPVVGEGSPYPYLTSPSDEKVQIALQKRGGLDTITWEATLRNDADIVTRLRRKLYELAIRTEANQVWDILKTNPTIYDSTALFDNAHGNTGTAALDATNLGAAIAKMRRQVPFGETDAMGYANAPVWLIIPPELEPAATAILVPAPGQTAASMIQRNYEQLKMMVVDRLTDTNNWYLAAADSGILLGFLDDQGSEPAIFVQDGETEGSVVTADQITFKVRHVFATAVEEYRGLYGSIVSGGS